MCGCYYLGDEDTEEDMAEILEALNRRGALPALRTSGVILPTDVVPVLANDRALRPTPFAMAWGYTLLGGKRIINARSETAAAKPLFADGMARRRCLIPAKHYFEWEKRDGAKIKYAIRPSGSSRLWLAGLYRIEQGQPVFTILTRAPAAQIAFIHDRMPVMLSQEAGDDWLNLSLSAERVLMGALLDVSFAAA